MTSFPSSYYKTNEKAFSKCNCNSGPFVFDQDVAGTAWGWLQQWEKFGPALGELVACVPTQTPPLLPPFLMGGGQWSP